MATRKRKPLARKPQKAKPDTLPFAAAERDIFYFCDHGQQCKCKPGEARCRRIDPMVVLEVLEEGDAGAQYRADIELLQLPQPTGADGEPVGDEKYRMARKRVGDILRTAFKLKPLSDTEGVTWHECVAIMTSLSTFLEGCKKKADALRTSLGLAPPPSFPKTLSATKSASASNSTSEGSTPSEAPKPAPESACSSGTIQEKHSGDTCPAT